MGYDILLDVKVAETEHLVTGQSVSANSVGLPGADMDFWGILITEVPKQEDIAFIMIGVARPALMEGHAIEIGISGMAHHLNVIK